LPFDEGCFDAVLIESVNAFVPEQARAFTEYARVIKPGGYVGTNEGTWVKTPPPTDLLNFIDRTMQAKFYPPEGWKTLLSGAGLEIIAAQVYPINIKALSWPLPVRRGLALSRLAAARSHLRPGPH
jgi:SAM-dependent methyltransferase